MMITQHIYLNVLCNQVFLTFKQKIMLSQLLQLKDYINIILMLFYTLLVINI